MECKVSNCLQHQGVHVYLVVIERFHGCSKIWYFNLCNGVEKVKMNLSLKGLGEQAFTMAKLIFTEVIYVPSVDLDSGLGSDGINSCGFL